MTTETGYKRYFGYGLAEQLATKLLAAQPDFPAEAFLAEIRGSNIAELELLARVDLLAAALHEHLPGQYPDALATLSGIFGPENPNETGMFTFGYWLWPVASFIATYGLDHHELSVAAIEELTKRHTGEHAIRPYIVERPEQTSRTMLDWAGSANVHVRRLASEGLRPRLPWSKKLTVFIDDPDPVFRVLDTLKDDESRFVQKSVANNLNDYLKDNRPEAMDLIRNWADDPTRQRRWTIKHALRNELKREAEDAFEIADHLD
jgi:3-methyladenine DNA glycosylase AlkC